MVADDETAACLVGIGAVVVNRKVTADFLAVHIVRLDNNAAATGIAGNPLGLEIAPVGSVQNDVTAGEKILLAEVEGNVLTRVNRRPLQRLCLILPRFLVLVESQCGNLRSLSICALIASVELSSLRVLNLRTRINVLCPIFVLFADAAYQCANSHALFGAKLRVGNRGDVHVIGKLLGSAVGVGSDRFLTVGGLPNRSLGLGGRGDEGLVHDRLGSLYLDGAGQACLAVLGMNLTRAIAFCIHVCLVSRIRVSALGIEDRVDDVGRHILLRFVFDVIDGELVVCGRNCSGLVFGLLRGLLGLECCHFLACCPGGGTGNSTRYGNDGESRHRKHDRDERAEAFAPHRVFWFLEFLLMFHVLHQPFPAYSLTAKPLYRKE